MTTPYTISYRRGDRTCFVPVHRSDVLTFVKRRPALVVSPGIFNERNEDLILLAVTSQFNSFSNSIPGLAGDCLEGALPKESRSG
jgi:hypothetical protein